MTQRYNIRFHAFPQTWLARVAAAILAAALVAAAFFFLVIFLPVAGIVILGIALRLLWRAQQVRDRATQDVLEGEYVVEPREKSAQITHKD
jgi:hypothetical protein